MVVLQRQHVVRARLADLAGDGLLAAHGVEADDGALQTRQVQHLRDRGGLVGLAVHRLLRQHQPRLGRAGVQQVHRAVLAPAAAQGLAVQAHPLARKGGQRRLRPAQKRRREDAGGQTPHHVAGGVVRGDAVGQLQKLPEPGLLLPREGLHPHPVLDPAQHRAEDGHQDVLQRVRLVLGGPPRIGKLGKIGAGIGQHGGRQKTGTIPRPAVNG